MTIDHVVRFRPEPEAVRARPGTVLSGDPEQSVRNVYTDPSGAFSAGIWESTPGKWPVAYTEEEFCLLLTGTVVLTDEQGQAETFLAGDAFIIRAGFRGSWETVEFVRKYYAVYERPHG